MEQKTWYSAQLLFRSEVITESIEYDTDTYEESIILIKATTKDEAFQIALNKGKTEEQKYKNDKNEEVSWRFIKVIDVFEILEETINCGTEVFSRFILVPTKTNINEILNRFYQEQ